MDIMYIWLFVVNDIFLSIIIHTVKMIIILGTEAVGMMTCLIIFYIVIIMIAYIIVSVVL